MSDDEAYVQFRAVRWAGGKPVCPHAECGCDAVYEFKTRRLFKCKKCEKQFTATSGTKLASRKMSFRDILLAIAVFVNGVDGVSACRMSRELSCDYKTAFVVLHKLREPMGSMGLRAKHAAADPKKSLPDADRLTGEVEVDGAYFGGHMKKANLAKGRKDMRVSNPKRRCVVTIRERRPGGRTLTYVVPSESDAVNTVIRVVHPSASVRTDEGPHWGVFKLRFKDWEAVKHKEAYSYGGGIHTNWVESFNGRLRRAEDVHRHISGIYLPSYANEVAWREDHRRVSNGVQFSLVAGHVAKVPKSERMVGYWQRRGPRPTRRRPAHLSAPSQAATS